MSSNSNSQKEVGSLQPLCVEDVLEYFIDYIALLPKADKDKASNCIVDLYLRAKELYLEQNSSRKRLKLYIESNNLDKEDIARFLAKHANKHSGIDYKHLKVLNSFKEGLDLKINAMLSSFIRAMNRAGLEHQFVHFNLRHPVEGFSAWVYRSNSNYMDMFLTNYCNKLAQLIRSNYSLETIFSDINVEHNPSSVKQISL
jgi:hypothetical protein